MLTIRDKNHSGLTLPPLLKKYKITRCKRPGCKSQVNTIVKDDNSIPFGLCEKHYESITKRTVTNVIMQRDIVY